MKKKTPPSDESSEKAGKPGLEQQRPETKENEDEETPVVYKFTIKGSRDGNSDRRKFLKNAAIGLLGFSAVLSACEKESEIDLQCIGDKCTCHVVCTCDTVSGDDSSRYSVIWNGTVCTCNKVCTCNTVSTCGCDAHSSGSYYYPN